MLWMDLGVTVDLRGTADQEAGLDTLRKTKHVEGPHKGGLDGLDGIELVVRRGCRAGEVVDLCANAFDLARSSEEETLLTVALDHEWFNNVVANHLKVGVANPMTDSGLRTSEEVIDNGDLVPQDHEAVDKMGSNESGTTCDQDALALRGRQQLDRGESRERGVRDRVCLRIVDRVGLEFKGIINLGFCRRAFRRVLRGCSLGVVGTQVERSQDIDRDLAVESKPVKTNRGYG